MWVRRTGGPTKLRRLSGDHWVAGTASNTQLRVAIGTEGPRAGCSVIGERAPRHIHSRLSNFSRSWSPRNGAFGETMTFPEAKQLSRLICCKLQGHGVMASSKPSTAELAAAILGSVYNYPNLVAMNQHDQDLPAKPERHWVAAGEQDLPPFTRTQLHFSHYHTTTNLHHALLGSSFA